MKANIVAAGIPGEKIIIAPNAVGGAFLDQPRVRADARRELGLPEDGLYIGTVSSLVAYEGLDDLVRAFALLAPEFPQLRLLIVGDGVAAPALQEQVRGLGLADRAIFTGRVPRDQTPLYHQALDVFVVPRKDLDVTRAVTPLKPVEALASCTAGGWKRPARTSGDNRRRRQRAFGSCRVTGRACTHDLGVAARCEPTGIDGPRRPGRSPGREDLGCQRQGTGRALRWAAP